MDFADLHRMIQSTAPSENPQQAFWEFLRTLDPNPRVAFYMVLQTFHQQEYEVVWKAVQMLWQELKASYAKITELEFANAGLEFENEILKLEIDRPGRRVWT